MSRATLAAWGRRAGLDVPAERIISSLSATAAYTARAFPGEPLYVLASEDARTEFAGQRLLTHDGGGERSTPGRRPSSSATRPRT